MATSRGRESVHRFMSALPVEIENKVLRGAARAAAKVIADEARTNAPAAETREAITVKSRAEAGRITVKVTVKPGWGRSLGFWSEYGTDPHFISVAEDQRGGMRIKRINKKTKDGSLVIAGNYVGATVFHPGAGAHPFLRPALDLKGAEAKAAARSFIAARVTRAGIVGDADPEGSDA